MLLNFTLKYVHFTQILLALFTFIIFNIIILQVQMKNVHTTKLFYFWWKLFEQVFYLGLYNFFFNKTYLLLHTVFNKFFNGLKYSLHKFFKMKMSIEYKSMHKIENLLSVVTNIWERNIMKKKKVRICGRSNKC